MPANLLCPGIVIREVVGRETAEKVAKGTIPR
jgi:hypothetical protein